MPIKTIFLSLLFSAFFAAAHAQVHTGRKTLSQKSFARKMKKKNVVLIDVRTSEEYNAGHLPGALHMDVLKQEDFKQQMAPLPKKQTYLLYCKSGRRSEKALNILYDSGFKKVYHLKGGYTAWQGAKE